MFPQRVRSGYKYGSRERDRDGRRAVQRPRRAVVQRGEDARGPEGSGTHMVASLALIVVSLAVIVASLALIVASFEIIVASLGLMVLS